MTARHLESCLGVDVFSPPESPILDISVVEDHSGPELDQCHLFAPAPVIPEARAVRAKHVVRIAHEK